MLKAHEAELNALGFQLRPNAQGQVGKIQWGSEPIVDVIQGAGSGLNRKQWLAGGPPGGGGIGQGLENTPGYQFRLGEGLKALERSAASRGTLLTGGTLKGLQKYAQDVASTEYGNRVNQLTGLSNLGLGATGTAVGAGTMYGNQLAGLNTGYGTQGSDLLTQRGNAQAAGTVGGQNAWTQGINNAIGSGMNMYALSQLGNPAANPYGGGGPVNTGGPLRGGYGYPQPTWYPQGPPGMGI
jgi:hypothetical protein